MKKIKIYFEDFWPDFKIEDNFIINVLRNEYDVSLDRQPDYLFVSDYGLNHLKYSNCIKIHYTGENIVPDFDVFDYGMGFHYLTFGDRYIRYPLYVWQGLKEVIYQQNKTIDTEKALNRKFCNFVYGNHKMADPTRTMFFKRLSEYKQVDSGGLYMNNIGRVINPYIKVDFLKDYKFTIAFENSSVPGYTTEKMVNPMEAGSMPIYWGNTKVGIDFNNEAIINVHDYKSIEAAIEDVVRLDNDDSAYIEKLSKPWISEKQLDYNQWQEKFTGFLKYIIEQDKTAVRRTTDYGFVAKKRQNQEYLSKMFYPYLGRVLRFVFKRI